MKITVILFVLAAAARCPAGDFPGAEGIVARRVPWLEGRVRFERLAGSPTDAFELRDGRGVTVIAASGENAAATGLGWYLKYYCHRSMSHVGDNLGPADDVIPVGDKPVRIESWAIHRYALNYCTFNYTMSFYSWADWEHELDWMALSGVNLMLVANGEEAVWRNTLRRLGFGEDEISAFIPGPAYTAWWLMGNVEGVGGPMSAGMIDRRADVQRRILARMRELGIEAVLPGFYGMVPSALSRKVKAHIVDQGPWCGFRRPSILDPTDPEFARVAGVYYDELRKLYGPDIRYFSGDPFHEGGVMAGVDLGKAGLAIQREMQAQFPGSVWVLQGWLENPRAELLASVDRSHVLVQELFGEQTSNWEKRRAYEGTPFVWCVINNFGERPGLFGRLQHYCDEVYRARSGPYGRYLDGTGIMPEGIANNPVAYDLVLELSWRQQHVDATDWIAGYEAYRYGAADPDIAAAWILLLETAYGDKPMGITENALCSRPQIPAGPASHWGSLELPYDAGAFSLAERLFARAEQTMGHVETYRLDLVALRLQALSNDALSASRELAAAGHDRAAFDDDAGKFLGLGAKADALLETEPFYRMRTYQCQALAYGTTDAERAECLRNAMALVTYWAGNERSEDELHDYAFKAWSGMMSSYSMGRWKAFFDDERAHWGRSPAAAPDFFAWERRWAEANSVPSSVPPP